MFKLFRRKKQKQQPEAENTRLAIAALLTYYLKPNTLPSSHTQEDWKNSLGAKYTTTIQRLVKSGDLRRPNLHESLQFARAKDIKSVLKEHDLRVSGRKAKLIERLIENAPDAAQRLAEQYATDAYVVTESGQEKASTFQKEQNQRKTQAKLQVRDFIKRGNLTAACAVINQFYIWLPPVLRPGMGMNWDSPNGGMFLYLDRATYILNNAHSSWIAQELPQDLRESLIFAAIENELWPGRITTDGLSLSQDMKLKRPVDAFLRLFMNLAANARDLQNAKEMGITKVGIRTANDEHICSHCQQLSSKTYFLSEVPVLPSPHCTNEICRCSYSLFPDD